MRNQPLLCLAVLPALLVSGHTFALSTGTYGLEYNYTDGTLAINGINRGLLNYVIQSDGAFLESDDFTDQLNHQLIVSVATLDTNSGPMEFLIGTPTSLPSEISETSIQANDPTIIPQTPYRSLGPVLPPNLSQSEFENTITSTTYVTDFGQPIESFDLVYVPEPASLSVLALGGLALVRRRRSA